MEAERTVNQREEVVLLFFVKEPFPTRRVDVDVPFGQEGIRPRPVIDFERRRRRACQQDHGNGVDVPMGRRYGRQKWFSPPPHVADELERIYLDLLADRSLARTGSPGCAAPQE
jgi:hypothetical protein